MNRPWRRTFLQYVDPQENLPDETTSVRIYALSTSDIASA